MVIRNNISRKLVRQRKAQSFDIYIQGDVNR